MLFDGDDDMFKREVAATTEYAEYGFGNSTIWVNNNTNCHITSVDTSSRWIHFVGKSCNLSDRLTEIHVDLGELTKWEWPTHYNLAYKFAVQGTKITFDDYLDRHHYHIVEVFLKPIDFCGRQALFCVPNKKDANTKALDVMIQSFRFVMD